MRKKLLFCIISFILMMSLYSCSTPNECVHTDADDDNKCDECGADFNDGYRLDGKKIIFSYIRLRRVICMIFPLGVIISQVPSFSPF